ncbi:RRP8 (YDR083W) [Zygosaccharomyces parabailii]|uniref:Ribosomal RNA-processing protein 8 n=1 Tax=Zygosaccharomyces bailii (strain CLIB 213 / ATCC 58445 / CBS 680 / BCRC 21525 / NBRC 1098 / NCYC 1416 / NRRL Y-2227) TaxID=1333698 RepID=A0A8J2T4V0_ZYGB2|nr:RRP8 (YDR083W) [Zygosaccharomyces parabailii]CDF88517.1 BN860_12112g1_1 [Zygosaccharomyces bailii CLIB 213]CDH14604.1 probable Ribosomal RNA-processing protein 8 [Zygosaccharomyces bailii ISA1307]
MVLFNVDGWDLKTDNVIYYDASSERAAQKKKEQKEKKKEQKKQQNLKKSRHEEPTNKLANASKRKMEEPTSPLKENKVKFAKLELKAAPRTEKTLTPLQQKMMAKLTGSRFRWINEQLYTISSEDALRLIQEQPQLFDEYHDGFKSQVASWPENPVDVFVEQIRQRSKKPINAPGGLPGLPTKQIVIADMGCGEAQLALDINKFFSQYNKKSKKYQQKSHVVHSFDLKKANDRITVADIKHVPLPDSSCSIVVFCLALMGTNFLDFIKEAYRILAPRGELWIAEIKSRFADGKGDEFVEALKLLGFFHKKTDNENKMFTRFEFFKPPQDIIDERRAKLERRHKFIETENEKEALEKKRLQIAEGKWLLKPCIYKRR